MKKLTFTIAVSAILAVIHLAQAETIAVWTFQSTGPSAFRSPGQWYTNITADVGSGVASARHNGFSTYNSFPGNGSSRGLGVTNGWTVGDFYQFAISSLGYQNLSVSFDQAGTSGGPATFYLAYSTDGNSFTKIGSEYSAQVGNWNSTTTNTSSTFHFNLGDITSINDWSTVYFRIINDSLFAINGYPMPSYDLYQDNRIDNFTVSGQSVPEPGTMTLAALGVACAMSMTARKRLKK